MAHANKIFSFPTRQLPNDSGPQLAINLQKGRALGGAATRGLFEVNTVVAVYDTHDQAEAAIRILQAAGTDMRTLSIAGKNTHIVEQVSGFYTAGDRILQWGVRGAFWGGVWGLLFDSALFAIPGMGPVLLAGPLVSWIVAVLEGAVVFGGLSALGAGLINIGIPRTSVLEYETALKADKYLLMVHGSSDSVAMAKNALDQTQHSFCTVHGENNIHH